MKKNIFALILLALTINVSFTSCEDMLTGDMDRNVGIEEIAADTLYSYWGILRSLQNVAERYVLLGECRGDLVDESGYVSDSIKAILTFGMEGGSAADGANRFLKAADFYHVINSCNAYIQQCDTAARSGLNRPLMKNEYAQVVTIRAWAYMQLVLAYGRVPYFETPMLSTADMEDFRNAAQYVDINTLATSGVAQKVDEVRHIPTLLSDDPTGIIGYPDYGYYGGNVNGSYSKIIANASQCVFPQDVVLGDLYLLRAQGAGSEDDYRKAAQYYYNFLNSEKGGPLYQGYYCYFRKSSFNEQYYPSSTDWGMMWYNNLVSTSQTNEFVTIIPSSKNKLHGTVFRALNELFGFDQTLRVSADSTATGSIVLEPNFQHQLDASAAYTALNKAQDFEVYLGTDKVCSIFKDAGDARYRFATENYTDTRTGSADEVTFVIKQNPFGSFTTTYPVIYRKASIWLRFAQALNGAGFPGYAFAILRHGLVGSNGWVPTGDDSYGYVPFTYFDPTPADDGTPAASPNPTYAEYEFSDPTTATDDTPATIYTDYKSFFDDMLHPGLELLDKHADSLAYYTAHMTAVGKTRSLTSTNAICDYISARETQAAQSAPFLKLETPYLQGTSGYFYYYGDTEYHINNIETDGSNLTACSMGIHARGCGFLKLQEDNTTYTFVNQINKMRKLYEGATEDMTEVEVYDEANLRKVQEAIASLILDELALETAFEGNRFFDLLCYSRFFGGQAGVEKVARKIASRSGSFNSSLYSHLCDQQNWYFQLP